MQHSGRLTPQFFISSEGPCPYLEGQRERKLFTGLQTDTGEDLNNKLSQRGFRRSQNVVYKPACSDCNSCLSARVRVKNWVPGKRAKRLASRNTDIITEVRNARATQEQYDLFSRYVQHRHAKGGMADMDEFDYANMVEGGAVNSRLIEYRYIENNQPGALIACCLTDVLNDGLSMVYSFFEPSLAKRSLGAFMIINHISLARESHIPYLYLGYWVKNSPKMAYKSGYRPLEIYTDGAWQEIDPDAYTPPPLPERRLPHDNIFAPRIL